MPQSAPKTEALQDLTQRLAQVGLHDSATLVLDIIKPLDFLSSQVALFCQPFVRSGQWGQYTAALTAEAGWQELRQLLHQEGFPKT
jgi:hypothetical protein